MLTFGGQHVNNPSSRAAWLSEVVPQRTIKRSETSINGFGFKSPPPKSNKRMEHSESTLQRYMQEKESSKKENKFEFKLTFPKAYAKKCKI
jgi:hypothetical protein